MTRRPRAGGTDRVERGGRVRSLALGAGFAAAAAGMGWLAVVELAGLFEAVRAQAPVVVVWSGAASALPASVFLGAIAVMQLRRPRPVSRASDRTERWLFILVLGCLPMLFVLPLLLLVASSFVLPAQGYDRCGSPNVGVRSITMEWRRGALGACPR